MQTISFTFDKCSRLLGYRAWIYNKLNLYGNANRLYINYFSSAISTFLQPIPLEDVELVLYIGNLRFVLGNVSAQ